ncbi:Os02g0508500, partial [Oryza sativa Japonica Group]
VDRNPRPSSHGDEEGDSKGRATVQGPGLRRSVGDAAGLGRIWVRVEQQCRVTDWCYHRHLRHPGCQISFQWGVHVVGRAEELLWRP